MKYVHSLYFFTLFISSSMNGMAITDPLELEKMATIRVSADNTKQCAAIAMDCWFEADKLFTNAFDNESAIKWFNYFIRIYNDLSAIKYRTPPLELHLVQAYTGIALAFHHKGLFDERDLNMAKAKELLDIDAPEKYKKFKSTAVAYFVVDGYRKCYGIEEPIEEMTAKEQDNHLKNAVYCFTKAIMISNKLSLEGLAKSQALHGLGVVLALWGKLKIKRGNGTEAVKDFQEAIKNLESACALRKKLMGESYPLVGSSLHEIARNYALLAETSGKFDLISQASKSYQQALAIFGKSEVASVRAKRDELATEYEKFKLEWRV